MRRVISIMLLAGMSSGAAAEWVKISELYNSTVYADPAASSRSGSLVQMSDMRMDCSECNLVLSFGDRRYTSQTRRAEYDCKEERIRTIYAISSGYPDSGNMNESKTVVSTRATSDWRPLLPGTADEMLWKVACGKW